MKKTIPITQMLSMYADEHQINYYDSDLEAFCKEYIHINNHEFIRDDSGFIYVDGEEGDCGYIYYYTLNNELICIEEVGERRRYDFSYLGNFKLATLISEFVKWKLMKQTDFVVEPVLARDEFCLFNVIGETCEIETNKWYAIISKKFGEDFIKSCEEMCFAYNPNDKEADPKKLGVHLEDENGVVTYHCSITNYIESYLSNPNKKPADWLHSYACKYIKWS